MPSIFAYGVDVSRIQGDINFTALKQAGKAFTIIKLSVGSDYIDPKAVQNISRARSAGMPFGLYHFCNARTVAEAREQAAFFIANARKYTPFAYPAMLDFEDFQVDGRSYYAGVSDATLQDIAATWLWAVDHAGFYACLYTDKDWAQNRLDVRSGRYKRYGIWYARYTGDPRTVADTAELGRTAGMIQYSSSGCVPGIAGAVDLDAATVNYPAIIASQGQNGFHRPPSVTLDVPGNTLNLRAGRAYQMRATGRPGTVYCSGDTTSVIILPRYRSGNDDFVYIVAVGARGSITGIYVKPAGEPGERRFVVKIV